MNYKEVEGIDENGNPTTFKIEIPSKKSCNKTHKECGYLNFTNEVLDLMERHNIKDVVKLEKDLEEVDTYKEMLGDDYSAENVRKGIFIFKDYLVCGYEGIDKKLKALEIIKEKMLFWDMGWLFNCLCGKADYKFYIKGCKETLDRYYANKEQYDLLKEVLNN